MHIVKEYNIAVFFIILFFLAVFFSTITDIKYLGFFILKDLPPLPPRFFAEQMKIVFHEFFFF